MRSPQEAVERNKFSLWGIVGLTYGLVIITTIIAIATYYWMKSSQTGVDQNDANTTRRIIIGAVWVPLYPGAAYTEASSQTEGSEQRGVVTQGTIHFTSKDGAGAVMSFYQDGLKQTGFFTTTTGNAGGTVQAIKSGGRTSVLVTVMGTNTGSSGEIRTLDHALPKTQ